MGGVLFLILTLVLVVILAWVHWGTGMVSHSPTTTARPRLTA